MATLVIPKDPKKGTSVQWYSQDGKRPSIYLGKVPKTWASEFMRGVQQLVEHQQFGERLDRKTSLWLSELEPKWRAKLAERGLVESLSIANLGDLVDHCREREESNEASSETLRKFRDAANNLFRFGRFDRSQSIRSISPSDAADYLAWLQKNGRQDGKTESTKLAAATVDGQIKVLRRIFDRAIDKDLATSNPFKGTQVVVGDADAQVYVHLTTVASVLRQCGPALGLRVALARYAGLRHPSEVEALELEWINLPDRRMVVYSPKNRRFEHKRWREVPIDPLLMPYLEEAIDRAPTGTRYVAFERRGTTSTSWRNALERACKRAGVVPWASLWNSLRGSRANDLLDAGVPEHVVVKWQNTSAEKLRKHYLRPTADHFATVTGVKPDAPTDQAEPRVGASLIAKVAAAHS